MVMLMWKSPLLFMMLCAWSIAAPGCGEIGMDADNAPSGTTVKGDASFEDGSSNMGFEAESAEPVTDVRGIYHLRLDSVLITESDDEMSTHHLELHAIAEIDQSNAWITLHVQPCEILLPEVSGKQPELPLEAVQSMAITSFEGSLIPGPTELGFDLGAGAIQLGTALDNPLLDTLPADAHDLELVDSDDDGLPGVSLAISGFKVYMAMRSILSFQGVVLTDGSLVGEAAVQTDFAIYGDNIPFVNVANKLEGAGEDTEIVQELHEVVLVRLSEGALDCAALDPSDDSGAAPLEEPVDSPEESAARTEDDAADAPFNRRAL